jgi:hypothetical protein
MKLFGLFTKKKSLPAKKPHKILKRIFAGLVIGGAIGAIIGKRTIDKAVEAQEDDIEM